MKKRYPYKVEPIAPDVFLDLVNLVRDIALVYRPHQQSTMKNR